MDDCGNENNPCAAWVGGYMARFRIMCVCGCVYTSVWMLGTDPVLPLAIAVLELLGLLGPEPGALLQREETGRGTKTDTGGRWGSSYLIKHLIYF